RQLGVGLERHPARDPELGGERPRRRKPRSGREPPAAYPLAKPRLELLVQGRARGAVKCHEEIGPRGNWLFLLLHNWTLTAGQLRRTVCAASEIGLEDVVQKITVIG